MARNTHSKDFPTQSAWQGSYAGGWNDGFVSKLNSSGSALVYSTYLGGTGDDVAAGIGVDGNGNAYLIGYTSSSDFPTQSPLQSSNAGSEDAFVSKLTGSGVLVYSTYLGGTGWDAGFGIAVDGSSSAYVMGWTGSNDFPTTQGALQTSGAGSVDLFIVNLANTGSPLALSPASANVPPMGAQKFTASGGSVIGYVYSLQTNASGGSINAQTGAYVAGATGSVVDVVKVVDANNNSKTSSVNVGAAVGITPSSPNTPPNGSVSFSAGGGSGSGFTWSIPTNNSGGSISSSTGAYTAGSTGSVTDTVKVVDSLGNSAPASVTVGPGVTISPSSPSTAPNGTISFGASGGSGLGYTWSVATNNSGASINVSTGAYTAGAIASVTDIVKVVDSLGNSATTNVSIKDASTDGGASNDGSASNDGGPGSDGGSQDGSADGGVGGGTSGGCSCSEVGTTMPDRTAGVSSLLALGAALVRRRIRRPTLRSRRTAR